MRRALVMLVWGLLCGSQVLAQETGVGLITIDGTIGPATANYVSRAIKLASSRHDPCLIIELDTPGGLLESTKEIVEDFYASPIPIVVYVAPSGASAASAGTFITMAANVAAMAPNTTIGAAHPVSLGPGGTTEKLDDVMKEKLENFASSYIESIAQKRGRNVQWAISAVRTSASVPAEKALELKAIDLIAANVPDLLHQLDGRTVDGHELKLTGAKVVPIPLLPRERLFQMLWRPEVMLILMLAAIYGIIGELSAPGAILPGVIGGIALILVLYMAAILPVRAAGLALVGLAFILFIIDVFTPTHGILTFGGIIAFFLGALMLFDRTGPYRLPLMYIIPATLVTAAFFLFVVGAGLRAQLLPTRVGREAMLGKTTAAVAAIDQERGKVFIEGEYWNAVSDTPVEVGHPVEIIAIEGLTLKVRPKVA